MKLEVKMTDSICDEFIRHTRLPNAEASPEERKVPQPPLVIPIEDPSSMISLPSAREQAVQPLDVRDAMDKRRTVRKYKDSSLTIGELSTLLWYTQGVKEVTSRPVTLRTVPSAGARHAFETVLLVNRVSDLKPGLYRYLPMEHQLLCLSTEPDLTDQFTAACLKQGQIANSAVTFFWEAVVERMTWRYQARGYRYLFLDAGHVCQNLILAAEMIQCGVCPIGAFSDDELNHLCRLDGLTHFIAYGATVGKKREG
jgi:SagB-type dehydrogenase family enzyme